MTDEQIIAILRELWRFEHTDKYTETEIRIAIEFAISKIHNYNNLLSNYIKISKEYSAYIEKSRHEIPLRDNY